MRGPLARDLMGVRADVEREHAVAGQGAAHRVDGGMRGERAARRPQRRLESVGGERRSVRALHAELLAACAARRASEESRSPVT